MKNITNNNEITRSSNGGGKWGCRVCGYSNNSYATVWGHVAGHVGKAYLKILALVFMFM